ncbi:MAG TPA: uroporphyrinogen-III synthase [Acidimicrobiales bacterium]|jgi:uroporphyrinogen-III synthase|nr:uroporphyrinogen-III synthase [Acidimicrobiales bacterium]
MSGPLAGRRVGVTADRRRDTQRRLLEARGATVVEGPTLASRSLTQAPELRAATESIVRDPPDVVVVDTGVGVTSWFEAAQEWGLADQVRDALQGAGALARGAKAASALRRRTGLVSVTSPDGRLGSLRAVLADRSLEGRRVVVQRSGATDAPLVDWLRARGATVVELEVYRWELPADRDTAYELVRQGCTGELDAVTFTSVPAVDNLFALAGELGEAERLRYGFTSGMVAACVGSVCAEAARQQGIADPLFPASGTLPDMVRLLTDKLVRA